VAAAKLLARVNSAALPPQPFAVQEVGARELDPYACPLERLGRLTIERLGRFPVAQQRPGARLDPHRPVGAAGGGCRRAPGVV
jgi:hypothetical protein